ncbi:MAG TPA: FmdB family zinc ribbon protein [Chloroflexota bacterium]|nr:FmdB family zinc ribbon protein [Chloroflexota bacterium]
MPLYEYACRACDQHIEVKQSFSDPPLTVHDGCGGELRRVLQPVGIVFKGSGWYITDSRKPESSSSESKSESKTDSKTEAKSESKAA